MGLKFNPFTGNFDFTGSGGGGGGSTFFTGEVATYADLPLDGTAPLNSRWLVRSNSGTWPFASYKQAGIYIRVATVGSSRDDDYTLTDTSFHDVMSDDAFLIFDNTDPTKAAKFDVGANVTAGQTRTLSIPDASGTIALTGDLHTQSHAMTGTSDHTAGNHKVFYSNGSGQVVELALGDSGKVLQSNGATSAPTWETASGGDTVSIEASAADILSVSSGAISADDAGSDKLIFWDDSAGKLTHLTVGSGLAVTDTTIDATGGATTETRIYTANDTWNKPAGAKMVHFLLIAGGGGGGSGRRGASGTQRGGGGGGSGGGIHVGWVDADQLSSTETITVGAGGAGGANAADSTDGTAGANGGDSFFGSRQAYRGNGGGAGTSTGGGAAGAATTQSSFIYNTVFNLNAGGAGANGNNSAGGTPSLSTAHASTGGGGGGGMTTADNVWGGGNATALGYTNTGGVINGGQGNYGGAGGNGTNGNRTYWYVGTGGGGSTPVQTGGRINGFGGNGALYGAGGGGGSGVANGAGDNKGGNGADGIVVITTYF